MLRQERVPVTSKNALYLAVQAGLDGRQAEIWTALPAIVQSFNAEKVTIEAQPTIQIGIRQPDGTIVNTTMPLCVDCPVMFPGAGEFLFTFPVTKGDEGLLVFSSRCIDLWWQNGGIAKQAELRMHDLSDGFFFPTSGLSQPKVPANVSTTSAQMRTKDGTSYIELAPAGVINVKGNPINFLGPAVFQEGVVFEGSVAGAIGGGGTINFGNTELLSNSKRIDSTHAHTDVQNGSDDSGPVA